MSHLISFENWCLIPYLSAAQAQPLEPNELVSRNLFYSEYLETIPLITPSAFDEMWSGLSKDKVKVYVR